MNSIVKNGQPKITISSSDGLFFFQPDEIVRMKASSNYTCIYFTNRRPMIIAKVLGEYEKMLASLGFVRTHRSHLVNKRHIAFIDCLGNIIMQDTSKAELSRRKKKEVLMQLKHAA